MAWLLGISRPQYRELEAGRLFISKQRVPGRCPSFLEAPFVTSTWCRDVGICDADDVQELTPNARAWGLPGTFLHGHDSLQCGRSRSSFG